MGKTRKFHLCISVRGALRWPKKQLKGILTTEDGRSMTADEVFDTLCDELSQGHEKMPVGECDNFDYKKGCMGHKE